MPLLSINNPLLEIDHIFVCVESAPDKLLLEKMGLLCSEYSLSRPEQGTASSLIFFENSYIELIWIENEVTAEIYAMRSGIDFLGRTHWKKYCISPFGLALHQKTDVVDSEIFYSKSLNNSHKSEKFINFAASNLAEQVEPLCFMIPESLSLQALFDPSIDSHRLLVNHPLGIEKLTNIRVSIEKLGNLTNPLSMLERDEIIEIKQNSFPLLELTFDYGRNKNNLDLRGIGIPIILKY